MTRKLALSSVAAFFAVIATSAFGTVAPVTWSVAGGISGVSDVSTDGTLVAAFNMAGTSVAVNGVTFAAFAVTSGGTTAVNGNFSFVESGGIVLAPSLGSTQAPFSNLNANYQTLLNNGISTSDNNTLTLTISGLVVGQQYEFQWWLNASSYNGSANGFKTTATAVNSTTLDDNTSNAIGGVGQFVIGTFTAGADNSEAIAFTGIDTGNAPTINALQLRAVPEPATVAILLMGGAFLVGSRLRQRARL